MTTDETLEAFVAEVRAAGQPWNRWGIWGSFVGVAALVVLQAIRVRHVGVLEGVAGVVLLDLAASWTCLVIAFVKRRRWERAHPLVMPSLAEPQRGNS